MTINETIKNNSRIALEVAVIGMAGRFPGSKNIHEFWDNLKNGVESISFFSEEEMEKTGVSLELINNPNYVKASGILENAEYFDASFFGYTPIEAEIMNPQMRIFHECAWEALEDAGYNPGSYDCSIGVYAGASPSFFWEALALLSGKTKDIGGIAAANLTCVNFLTTMTSYKFNLKGPSSFLQTACSTSLVAIHYACRSVLSGECHIALAGGIGLNINQKQGYIYEEGMILSPDGHCRAFDAGAKGTVSGNGIGIVVLKRLKNAILDRDSIYAVIKGSAINNDGDRKVGYTAPSVQGQVEVIQKAQAMAHVEPESIGYIETHGTATPLGDLIEIEALTLAFNTEKRNYCPIGSVKTNIGHLDAAAGVSGFIKTVLALKNKKIPPSLHFKESNPSIDFKNSPFYVNSRLTEWKSNYPRRAGVSAFGIGGTNAHVVLEEWPFENLDLNLKEEGKREYQLLLLSAKTQTALDKMSENMVDFLKENSTLNLSDTAYTLMVGRKHFDYRRILVCKNSNEAITALSASTASTTDTADYRKIHTFFAKEQERPIIFMFPGLGSQYVNMGRELFETEAMFQDQVNQGFEILKALINDDIKEILYPGKESPLLHDKIKNFEIAQPVIFIFEYALAQLLLKWGITPTAMIGYSFGEYVAACLAGVFSLADALSLIISRGKLIGRLANGVMLSVPLAKEKLIPLLNDQLDVAIDNGPSCIIAGPRDAVNALQEELKAKRCMCMPLDSSYPIHSKMMNPVLTAYKEITEKMKVNTPQIPYISNLTGTWITSDDAHNPSYWPNHLSQTVQFAKGIKELLKKKNAIFIEVGPGRDLNTMLGRYFEDSDSYLSINLVRPAEQNISDIYYLLNKIGLLWLHGLKVNWKEFYSQQLRGRISLPTYPFEKQYYWLETNLVKSELFQKSPDLADWAYLSLWKRSILRGGNEQRIEAINWMIFMVDLSLTSELIKKLLLNQRYVIIVKKGDRFEKLSGTDNSTTFIINPREFSHYSVLFEHLHKAGKLPHHIIHSWQVTYQTKEMVETVGTKETEIPLSRECFDNNQYYGFYSLLYMVKALEKQNVSHNIQVTFLTNHTQEVTGSETINPEKASVLGLLKVIPQEFPGMICRHIDINLPEPFSSTESELRDLLIEELTMQSKDVTVAFRDNQRWVQFFDPFHLGTSTKQYNLKKQGVYLLTGGLGNIGLIIAEVLVKEIGARLILTGRSDFPPEMEWSSWLQTHEAFNPISIKIKKIQQLQEMGGKILYFQVDVASEEEMQQVISQAETIFGSKINGVIHAAGVTQGISLRLLNQLSVEDCLLQFQAKVYGTLVLANLFKNRELDFCLLLSSISCVLGGLSFGAYAAANSFMDLFVKKQNRFTTHHSRWFSLNWDGMDNEKSAELFKRLFALKKIDQLVISREGKLQQRIERWVKLESLHREPDLDNLYNNRERHLALSKTRPHLLNPYVAPRTYIEKSIAKIWQRMSGFDQIGIDDNFFDLGGDSLKAINLISMIHKELNVKVSMSELFNKPTIKELAETIVKLEKNEYASIEPMEKKEYYPLSPAQKRLYILHRMDKQGVGYNIPFFYILDGEIDKNKFKHTFKMLISRHESLRTSFQLLNEDPVQRVHDEVEFEIKYLATDAGGEHRQAQTFLMNFIKSFDLAKAPLLRVGLVKEKEDRHILTVDMHHIISDGISINVVVKDFMALYQGKVLPELWVQYKDFSDWQNNEKKNESIRRQEDFWLREFTGEIPVLDLPADYIRPSVQSFEGSSIQFELDKETVGLLKTLILETGTTMYIVLLSVYTVFLAKVTNQEDIVVGSPIAGRRHADLEKIIGMFVNTLALRNFPSGEKTFTGFLQEVKEKALKAFENQDYQFEDIVERVVTNRDTSRNPIFDAVFILQNFEIPVIEILGLVLKPFQYENKTSKFDLTLSGVEEEDKVVCIFEFSKKLFRKETIERFIFYFKNLAREMIENKERRISDFEILTEEEKKQILFDFNDTKAIYPKEKTIHQLFEEQVSRTPAHVAVVGAGSQTCPIALSYNKLNEQSDRLAVLLNEKGVLVDTIVGIMMERTIEVIIGILGILKSSGAYLPIDPQYPNERIEYILKDSKAKIVLSGTEEGRKKIFVNGQLLIVNCERIASPRVCVHHSSFITHSSNHLAYVIYTSGSSGKPKGVMIEHREVHNFIEGITRIIEFRPGKVILALTTITFDIFGLETILPFCTGLRVVFVTENHQREIQLLEQLIINNCVDMLQATPTRIRMFSINSKALLCLKNLKEIMVGGEDFPVQLLESLKRSSSAKIYNMYGPTETTIWSSVEELTLTKTITIGSPIANTRIYILNKYGKIQPLKVAGEIYIGGDGVARGYLNNPELTADRFVKYRSYESYKTYIIYKTGDLARWLPDGNIEFRGRIDHQVKIRGFRIELGEIENRLKDYEGINDSVVIAKEDKNGEIFLCAFIVTGKDIHISGIKEYLIKCLPEYMVPSHFTLIEKIPLTPNGKIDRKALPDGSMMLAEEYVAPRNGDEERLVEAWAEVLGMGKEKIGINNNFFDLGGNSLKVIRLSQKLEKIFNREIPVLMLFRYSTISTLSEYLSRGGLPDRVFLDAEKLGKIKDSIQDTLKIFGDD